MDVSRAAATDRDLGSAGLDEEDRHVEVQTGVEAAFEILGMQFTELVFKNMTEPTKIEFLKKMGLGVKNVQKKLTPEEEADLGKLGIVELFKMVGATFQEAVVSKLTLPAQREVNDLMKRGGYLFLSICPDGPKEKVVEVEKIVIVEKPVDISPETMTVTDAVGLLEKIAPVLEKEMVFSLFEKTFSVKNQKVWGLVFRILYMIASVITAGIFSLVDFIIVSARRQKLMQKIHNANVLGVLQGA